MIKNLSANAGDIKDVGSISGLGRSPKEGMAIQSSSNKQSMSVSHPNSRSNLETPEGIYLPGA